MAITQNTAFKTVLADAWASTFAGGTLEIRTSGGTTLLASITLPNPAFSAASSGVATKTGTWSDTSANATGVAAQAVLISSDTLKTCTMTVTVTGGGGDVTLDDVNIVAGGVVTISTFTYTAP